MDPRRHIEGKNRVRFRANTCGIIPDRRVARRFDHLTARDP
jgi:hypothetical protein